MQEKDGRASMTKWNVTTVSGEREGVNADSASITPSGALTFYDGNVLALAYSPETWDVVVKAE